MLDKSKQRIVDEEPLWTFYGPIREREFGTLRVLEGPLGWAYSRVTDLASWKLCLVDVGDVDVWSPRGPALLLRTKFWVKEAI